LQGNVGLPGSHRYALALAAEDVPGSAAETLIQRVKSNVPEDLVADGMLRGSLRIEEKAGTAASPQFEGRGEIAGLRLASAMNKAEIGVETLPFLLTAGDSSESATRRRQAIHRSAPSIRFPNGPHMEFGPFPVAIGRVVSPTARGWIDRSGYNISLAGDADIPKALRVARMFGLAALQSATEGTAQVDLQIAGSWAGRSNGTASGFSAPQVTGTARLHKVRIPVRGAGSVEIASADMQLLPDELRVTKLNATAANTVWTGSLVLPRGCGTPAACQVHFGLNADQIALDELREWVSPSPETRPWYRVLAPNAKTGPSFLANVRASGQLTTDRLQVQSLEATGVSARVVLEAGKLQITGLTADFLGGRHRGEWQADFSGQTAVCKGSGTVTGALLTDVADAMKDGWIAGTANMSYDVKGSCPAEFWTSAEGTLQFDMRDGTLPHVLLVGVAEPLKVTRFMGKAQLRAGAIETIDARLDSPGGQFEVSGTASLNGELDFKLVSTPSGAAAAAGYAVTGTVAEPRVIRTPNPDTQARLKPEPGK
jgi:hypothetical protein